MCVRGGGGWGWGGVGGDVSHPGYCRGTGVCPGGERREPSRVL